MFLKGYTSLTIASFVLFALSGCGDDRTTEVATSNPLIEIVPPLKTDSAPSAFKTEPQNQDKTFFPESELSESDALAQAAPRATLAPKTPKEENISHVGSLYVKFSQEGLKIPFNRGVGVLVKENIFVTNAHCLGRWNENTYVWTFNPLNWLKLNNISKSINVTFSNGEERVAKKIHYIGDVRYDGLNNKYYQTDFAIIELAPSKNKRVLLPISQSGFEIKNLAYVIKARVNENKKIDFQKEKCVVAETTSPNDPLRNQKAFVRTTQCPIEAGDSGSGLLTANGELGGIIFGHRKPDAATEKYQDAFGISFACIDFDNLSDPWRSYDPNCPASLRVD